MTGIIAEVTSFLSADRVGDHSGPHHSKAVRPSDEKHSLHSPPPPPPLPSLPSLPRIGSLSLLCLALFLSLPLLLLASPRRFQIRPASSSAPRVTGTHPEPARQGGRSGLCGGRRDGWVSRAGCPFRPAPRLWPSALVPSSITQRVF